MTSIFFMSYLSCIVALPVASTEVADFVFCSSFFNWYACLASSFLDRLSGYTTSSIDIRKKVQGCTKFTFKLSTQMFHG